MLCHKSNIKIVRYHRSKMKIVRDVAHESKLRYLFSDSLTSAPQPPQNLSVSNVGETTADLDWDDITAPYTFDDYTIYVKNSTTDTVEQTISGLTSSSHTVTSLVTGDDYEFWVVSVRDSIESEDSNHVTAAPVDVTSPSAPTGLTVVQSQNKEIDLSWDANSESDLDGYNVYVDPGTGFAKENSSLISGTTYTITGLTNGQSYDIKITAVDIWGNESSFSNTVTTTVNDTNAPSAPTGLISTAKTDTTIDIDWDDNTESDLAGYNVYLDGSKVASLVANSNYQITGLTENTQYDIYVTAEDGSGNESNSSSTIQVTTDNIAPSAPTGLSVVPKDEALDASWDANTEHDIAGYNVYVDGVKDNNSLISGTSYTITGLTNGQSYDIKVTAIDSQGAESAFSAIVSEAPGVQDFSLSFDGTDLVDLGDSGFDNFTNGLTIEVWAKPTSVGSWQRFVEFSQGQNDDNIIFGRDSNSDDLTYSVRRGTSNQAVTATDVLELDSWNHYATTHDTNEDVVIYKNGSQVASGTVHTPNDVPRDVNHLAESAWSADDEYVGLMEKVRIWGEVRTQQEIKDNIAVELTGSETNLIRLFKFDDDSDTSTAIDSSGNLDGVITGASYSADIPEPYLVQNMRAIGGDQVIDVEWEHPLDFVANGYNVYVDGVKDNSSLITGKSYQVTGLTNRQVYNVTVATVDLQGSEVAETSQQKAKPIVRRNLLFDGVDQWANLGTLGDLGSSHNANQITFEFKFRSSNTGGIWILNQPQQTPSSSFGVVHGLSLSSGDNFAQFLRDDDTSVIDWSSETITMLDDNWHHVAYVIDSANNLIKIYFDGQPLSVTYSRQENVDDWIDFINDFPLGCKIDTSNTAVGFWGGRIEYFRIWKEERTKQEIKNNMDFYIDSNDYGVTYPNLYRYYKFQDGAGDTVTEEVAGDNAALNNNSADNMWETI